MLKYFQIQASTKSSVVWKILLERKTLESREMFISWNCGAPFCNFEYLIQGNSQIFSRKCIFCLRIVWVLFCGFLCAVCWYLLQFSSVAQSCPTLCNLKNRSRPGLPVHHQLLEFTQTHVHRVVMPSSHLVLCHPLSSCPQSLPASGSFPMCQLFAWGGHSIGISASAPVLPTNTKDWSPLGWTGCISLQSKGLPKIFSNTTF